MPWSRTTRRIPEYSWLIGRSYPDAPRRDRRYRRTTRRGASAVRRRAPQDEFEVPALADLEQVLADLAEAVARIEALRAGVLRPRPHPERARTAAQQPVEGRLHQPRAMAGALQALHQVQPLDLAVARRNVRVRQPAGPGRHVADRLAAVLEQPYRVVRVRQDGALAVDRIGLGEECREILRRIEMAEGFGEGTRAKRGHGGGVLHRGTADFKVHRVAPT